MLKSQKIKKTIPFNTEEGNYFKRMILAADHGNIDVFGEIGIKLHYVSDDTFFREFNRFNTILDSIPKLKQGDCYLSNSEGRVLMNTYMLHNLHFLSKNSPLCMVVFLENSSLKYSNWGGYAKSPIIIYSQYLDEDGYLQVDKRIVNVYNKFPIVFE